ncbi:MAG: helix-turn-helix domain-containing protein [Oscillospiraceae bacterium]|nr:helix-turn-helix domain-containing protein [Oscillospiraceae bacterium]
MYKIMIADDEGIVIDALKYIIEKSFGDSCQVQYAKTGRSVIELAESFRPDIALMDIQMPGINGIEAMKEIRKTNKSVIFIVITAYDKFDYAREAVGLGVMEYLNKPIDRAKLTQTLKQAMERIDSERERRRNDLRVREQLETAAPIVESGFIYSVLFQQNYAREVEQFKALLGVTEDSGFMMVIEYDALAESESIAKTVDVSVQMYENDVRLRETIKEFFPAVIGPQMANTVILFVPCARCPAEREYEQRVQIIQKARMMAKKLQGIVPAKFRVGIGSVKSLEDAHLSYTEAVNSSQFSSGEVAHAGDLPLFCGYEEDYPVETEKAIFECVQRGDVAGTVTESNRYFEWMAEKWPEDPQDVRLKSLEFVLWAERIAYGNGGQTYRFTSRRDYLPTVFGAQNPEELRSWFLSKMQSAAVNLAESREKRSAGLIKQAQEYIRSHFAQDLSLDSVSRQINVSPYYFSKLFKEETGQTFVEWLTGVRMEKAKTLLSTTDKSMKEICSAVGYSDPNYFSRSFKKNTGETPTEYRGKQWT